MPDHGLGEDPVARMLRDLERVDLGDPRRVRRAQEIVERLARMPNESLPTALVTSAELEGAYRFFNNRHVSFDELLGAHIEGTVDRARQTKLALAIHDTTTCKFPHADPEEVGVLPTGKAGFLLHLTLLVDAKDWKRPLGLMHGEAIGREQRSRQRHKRDGCNVSGKEMVGWEDKEYARWLRGIAATEQRLDGRVPVIHVADSETDSFHLMATLADAGQRFVLRARHNRIVTEDGEKMRLRDAVSRGEVRLKRDVPLSSRAPRKVPRSHHVPRETRTASLAIATTTTTLARPRGADGPTSVMVNVIHVFEPNPPSGETPVEWMLYTTEEVRTADQVADVVDYYRARWLIEELNKALKTGCVVQKRQLESYDAILNMLALSLPIAVELLALRSLARQDSKRPATAIFSPTYIDALRALSHRKVPKNPSVTDALWCIAGIGGHIKNNGAPGWQVLQRGMEQFLSFAAGWAARDFVINR
jgi:hypothetical protein